MYKQINGVAMDSPLGPALANIFVCYKICHVLLQKCNISRGRTDQTPVVQAITRHTNPCGKRILSMMQNICMWILSFYSVIDLATILPISNPISFFVSFQIFHFHFIPKRGNYGKLVLSTMQDHNA